MEAPPECTMVLVVVELEELEQMLTKVQGVSGHRVQLLELLHTMLEAEVEAVACQELQIPEALALVALVAVEMAELTVRQEQMVLEAAEAVRTTAIVMWVKTEVMA
tara:strand:- start:156 stop:473 length:318 start_codon:yes stop_codon:yes gene_type:complete